MLSQVEYNKNDQFIINHAAKQAVAIYSATLNNRSVMETSSGGCHYSFYNMSGKVKYLAIQICTTEEKEALAYTDWITSDDGPFKYLWSDEKPKKLFTADGRFAGLGLGPNIMNKKPWGLMFGFLIMSRTPYERKSYLKAWYKLVHEYGMHPADAYIISQGMNFNGVVGGDLTADTSINWTGSHQIFNETRDYHTGLGRCIDVKGFREGRFREDVDPNSYKSSDVWSLKGGKRKVSSFPLSMYSTTEKSSFGATYSVIKEDSIKKMLQDFNKFAESQV